MNHALGRLLGLFCSLLCCLSLACSASAAPPPPAEAFFQNAAFHGATLSPSGLHLAMVVGSQDARDRLAVLDLQTLKVQVVASFTDGDVFDYRWVNDKRLIFNVGDCKLALADHAFAGGLFAVNADGSGYRQLAQREHVWVQDNIGTRQLPWNTFPIHQDGAQDSDDIVVVRPEANDFASLLRLNTATGTAQDLDSPLHANQWLLDAQGNVRAARTSQGQLSALHWRDPASGKWRKLREFDRFTGHDVSLLAVMPDGKLLVSARPGRNTDALYVYDPATDKLADAPLLGLQQYDVRPTALLHHQGKLLGVRLVTDAEVTHWFDTGMKAHQASVDQLLPNTANLITPPRRGSSPWLLVRAFSDLQPSVYYLFNTQTRKLSRVGSERPGIQPAQMSPMDMVRYKARDGLEIPAYLTLPASAGDLKKNLPLIVYVHGGPWARGATWQWQADVQFLASRGYAVLQPEFRGSVGFGYSHVTASFKQWGLAMQDDLADGARWAIAQGIADPKRICIIGASYGGYATLMGLAKDGDLFACGVDWVGVSDILLMYDAHWSDASDEWKRYGMPQMVGDRIKDAAQLEATSPIRLAARIKNPLLMAHGRIDRRVPIEHGRRMFDAVKGHNPNAEWVEYEKDGHGWSLPETDVDWWTRVEGFLARHIGRPQ